ncbi:MULTISPECIES: metallophosphoesterase family protein [Psychrobacillus]|uniref:Phosphoesterase n=1 Tax=Psychrobacillus faecigallinarum TaxID=2762235 RepID=A0ABR8R7G1_9BACI|nr:MULTISPECIES: metallophosphoesterase [Psychrobacillus]MBD7943649.1 metallophosphoesterase [Psychrobacillus faecigallinarum]QEY22797.1 metallophosphoesterase [Psychrobacillus sp. AK 1817]
MKILIMSDTHKDTVTMEEVIQVHQDEVQAIIHCGDSELDASYFEGKSIFIVGGNCDYDSSFPEEELITLDNEKILVVHGHRHQVKSTILPLSYRAQEVGATVVCFGHSHMLGAELQNGILFVNPGSLHKPRGRKEKSYAIVEKKENLWQVLFFSSEHKLIENVNLKTS